jgi:DNA-directed RNA polymerase subunit RPC12/RpoP
MDVRILPGPTIIYECYNCQDNIRHDTIGSGNTCDVRFWTDGKRDAPMLPDQAWLIKCPHCRVLIWVDELKYLGEVNPWDFIASEEI